MRCPRLFVRRECRCLTFSGRLVVAVVLLLGVIGTHLAVHPLLAITKPVRGELLVVEGWATNESFVQAAAEFDTGRYQRLLVVRAVYDVADPYTSGRYSGDYVAQLLVKAGVPKDRVDTLFFSVVKTDRTYQAALAVRHWLRTNELDNLTVTSMDVATRGTHARRSRLLYRKAFDSDIQVGVIALESRTYDSARWWQSSEGVRQVVGEAIAYVYARLFFWPRERSYKATGSGSYY